MADVKAVAIRLVAYNDQYKAVMKESGSETAAFSKVSTVALAAVGTAAVAFALKSADAYVTYGKSIMGLSRVSGENVTTTSKWAFAAQQSGVSADSLSTGIKFLEKNMAAGNAEFGKLGVSTTDANGKLRSTHAVFLDTADAISKMANGAAKTDAILKVFGRSGLALGPMLNKGREGILALEAETEKYGLVLTQGNVAAIQANITAHRQLDAAMQGLQVRVGQQVLPVLTAFATGTTNLLIAIGAVPAPVLAIGAALTAVVVVGPRVVAGFQAITAEGGLMGAAMGGAAAVGIGLVLKGLHDIEEQSKATQTSLSGSIDWSTYKSGADGINKEGAAVDALGAAWDNMSAAEKLANPGKFKVYNDAAAQLEEDEKHLNAFADATKAVARELGITVPEAEKLTAGLKVDPTTVPGDKLIAVLKGVRDGSISTADATTQLGTASREAAGSAEDQAAAMDELKKKTKEANDAETAALAPQVAFIDAQRKAADSRRAVGDAERSLEAAHRGVADAEANVVKANNTRLASDRKVTDAIKGQQDAQRDLNDLLNGAGKQSAEDSIEAAKIALEEAQRKAAGITGEDPGLEARKNALDVRRAQRDLDTAEQQHGKDIEAAQKRLADATQAVTDARQAQQDAAKGVADANLAVKDAAVKVADAEKNVNDAQWNSFKSAMELDTATRNYLTAYATGDASVDQNIAALKRWVDQGLITADNAWNLAAALGAARDAAGLLDPDSTTNVGKNKQYVSDMDAGRSQDHSHASGGMLDEGWNYVHKDEAMLKSGPNVWVRTASATRGMVTPHAQLAGGTHFEQHNEIHADVTDRALDEANRRGQLALSTL